MKYWINTLATAILLAASNGFAQETQLEEKEPTAEIDPASIQNVSWTFGVGVTGIDSDKATEECVDSSATALQLGYENQDGHFVYQVGMSGYLFGDNCKFNQTVVDGFGDSSSESSSANGFGVFGEIGYSTPLKSDYILFDVTAGVEKIWAERGIGYCSNCYSENINIDSGLYIRPRIKFINDNGFTFSIGYQYFPNADIEGGVTLTFGITNSMF